jgi:hypothetical protein
LTSPRESMYEKQKVIAFQYSKASGSNFMKALATCYTTKLVTTNMKQSEHIAVDASVN